VSGVKGISWDQGGVQCKMRDSAYCPSALSHMRHTMEPPGLGPITAHCRNFVVTRPKGDLKRLGVETLGFGGCRR